MKVKAEGGQRARPQGTVGGEHSEPNQHQGGQRAVAGRPVERPVRRVVPQDAGAVEVERDAREDHQPAILARSRDEVRHEPALSDVSQEMQRRQHRGFLQIVRRQSAGATAPPSSDLAIGLVVTARPPGR